MLLCAPLDFFTDSLSNPLMKHITDSLKTFNQCRMVRLKPGSMQTNLLILTHAWIQLVILNISVWQAKEINELGQYDFKLNRESHC